MALPGPLATRGGRATGGARRRRDREPDEGMRRHQHRGWRSGRRFGRVRGKRRKGSAIDPSAGAAATF